MSSVEERHLIWPSSYSFACSWLGQFQDSTCTFKFDVKTTLWFTTSWVTFFFHSCLWGWYSWREPGSTTASLRMHMLEYCSRPMASRIISDLRWGATFMHIQNQLWWLFTALQYWPQLTSSGFSRNRILERLAHRHLTHTLNPFGSQPLLSLRSGTATFRQELTLARYL